MRETWVARVAAGGRTRLAMVMQSEHFTQQRLLDVADLAERLCVSERFVRRIVAERRIPIQRVGRHIRFREEDVDAFLEAGYLPRKPWGRA